MPYTRLKWFYLRVMINRFYIKYIRPADPGFFLTKYAGKAFISCLASFSAAMVLGFTGQALFWCMVGAVCVVLFRTGSTLRRRKIYALTLLALISITVPAAAVLGNATLPSLVFIFILSFACMFAASAGLSASKIGNGCLIITLISIFSPAEIDQGALRSASLIFGGAISFLTNFFLFPFDPQKILFSAGKLAVEDMAFFLDRSCARVKDPGVTDKELSFLNSQAIVSIRRYRTFLESFSIDPFKGAGASGGPGLFYFALVRMFESIVALSNHIHFSDNHPEFDRLKADFSQAAGRVSKEFRQFSKLRQTDRENPAEDTGRRSDPVNSQIDSIRQSLLTMGGYKAGDKVREEFLEAWAAVYGLKNVWAEFRELKQLAADTPFLRSS